ncbi:hypothetical protein C7212DRAFT_314843 [Tuber magnatum]|uniref:Uncharacterized protein n=1 Tax=Tuber magnatum TaxID=42249 RepID=A0A317STD6_9PEZI|nr:hypothetical protein C7212DRAFT_314843 [Tuber magnatum]
MEVRVCGWRVEKEEEKKGRVDWERGERVEKQRNREELEKLIEQVEGWIKGKIEECRERRKWKWKNKKWWNEEIEEEYRRGKERLKEEEIKTAKGDY